MKINEVRALSPEELSNELDRLKRHLFDLRAQAVTERLEDPTMISKAKTDIARLLTVQHQRELESAVEEEPSLSESK
ncbi:MAG: 50S ribosomal protein L29 [Phycisphaerae bacterium]|jgi:large subunit ribosomal protein L29|nr:50S ribosomal protein L29 [Phycisphaerae bacterium]